MNLKPGIPVVPNCFLMLFPAELASGMAAKKRNILEKHAAGINHAVRIMVRVGYNA